MKMTPRPYQSEAIEAVESYVKKNLSPCLIELPTGAGKAYVVSRLAGFFQSVAPRKRVLCIAPNKELVEQNHETYTLEYGFPASIYCASAGKKCMRHKVIFCSPQSALKNIEQIARLGISAIILDECQMITDTVKALIDAVKSYTEKGITPNKNCRVIGTTATPYRMGTGYIYAIDGSSEEDIHLDEEKAINPYFNRLLYRVTTGNLIDEKFLSKLKVGYHDDNYDTSSLKKNSMGKFTSDSVEEVFSGNTKTERIIKEVINRSIDKMGVMIFASTISHAEEILGYLPKDSKMVTGKLRKTERAAIVNSYKRREFKFIVNVDVLTVGVNFPHVDVIAVLRATESPGLFQQIVGRALRLHPEKEFALLFDYAENIERHGLQSDIFTPDIKTRKGGAESEEIEVVCPACSSRTMKKRRNDPMYDGLEHDEFGNFLVAGTNIVMTMQVLDPRQKNEFGELGTKEIPVPAHYSRRCSNPEAHIHDGKAYPCSHRFSFKTCPTCFEDNDIAARHCTGCKARLVDPNAKLTDTAGSAAIMSEGETKEVICLGAEYSLHTTSAGSETIKVTYKTELGAVTGWHSKKQHWIFNRLARANGTEAELVAKYSDCSKWDAIPKTIKIKKSIKGGYTRFEVREVKF